MAFGVLQKGLVLLETAMRVLQKVQFFAETATSFGRNRERGGSEKGDMGVTFVAGETLFNKGDMDVTFGFLA